MDLFQRARRLADLLVDSYEFHVYQEAEVAALNDPEVDRLSRAVHQAEHGLAARGHEDVGRARELTSELRRLQADLQARPVFAHYEQAREQFDRYVTLVLDQISYGISGTQRQDVPCGKKSDPPAEVLQGAAFEAARELSEALLNSDEYVAFQEAERLFVADAETRRLMDALRDNEQRLRGFAYASKEEGRRLAERSERLRGEIARRPSYEGYSAARRRFDQLVGVLLDTVSLGITGWHRDDTGCGSSGSSCGCGLGLDLPSATRIERVLSAAG